VVPEKQGLKQFEDGGYDAGITSKQWFQKNKD